MNKIPVIAIDGSSSSGKSTLSKYISNYLKWHLLDSGIFYRSLALVLLENQIKYEPNSYEYEKKIASIALNLNITCIKKYDILITMLNNKNITNDINTPNISELASILATYPQVRYNLLKKQRNFRQYPGLIANGRDMGSVVFPDAKVKIFLDANIKIRAKRRILQLKKKGFFIRNQDIIKEIKKRDNRDTERLISPLKPTKNALIIDSSNISIEQIIDTTLQYICHRFNIKYKKNK
ncbi:(d)CMP kinase [Candidatus Tachikawaea gelatinosa]|uniref:Cytidylate kinase n=1 Tax=Candidatus Tachikawaea gelatinosa TaxID=1410383 RepID=A0A090ARR6_9ENTR|nr:(d)CMP kinase [Candidatus Tachikawaea gelatinosa]BAP58505.1 cytidylate kinase [Candidatus Tachikawaea gelatinosa]